jgi:hypothetical protein
MAIRVLLNRLSGCHNFFGTDLVATKVLLHVLSSNYLSLSCLICYNVTWCLHDVFLKLFFKFGVGQHIV